MTNDRKTVIAMLISVPWSRWKGVDSAIALRLTCYIQSLILCITYRLAILSTQSSPQILTSIALVSVYHFPRLFTVVPLPSSDIPVSADSCIESWYFCLSSAKSYKYLFLGVEISTLTYLFNSGQTRIALHRIVPHRRDVANTASQTSAYDGFFICQYCATAGYQKSQDAKEN